MFTGLPFVWKPAFLGKERLSLGDAAERPSGEWPEQQQQPVGGSANVEYGVEFTGATEGKDFRFEGNQQWWSAD